MPLSQLNRLLAWTYTCPMMGFEDQSFRLVVVKTSPGVPSAPFYDLNGEEAKCEGTGCRKSWWCFTKDRGSWTLQRLLLTFSSTNMSWRVTGRCPQLKSASGASSTCTMSWGTSTHTVSPAVMLLSTGAYIPKLENAIAAVLTIPESSLKYIFTLYTQSKFLSPWIVLTRKLNKPRMSTLTYGQIQTHLIRMGNEDMGY